MKQVKLFDAVEVKPCVKCGAQDRYEDGDCRPCKWGIDAEYRRTNKEAIREYRAAHYRNSLKKSHAHAIHHADVKAGKWLPTPCEVCRASKVEAHHDDYDFPHVVRYLCRTHHARWHRDNGPGLNG